MVRASTLALHLNALQCALGLEILAMAHPRSAVFAFVPMILSGPLRGTVMQTVRSSAGAFIVSLFGSLLAVSGLASVLKLRDRTTRVGEKWFAMAHGALAMNCLAFRGRVQNAFPLLFVAHAVVAILFHLGDDFVVPLKFPKALGGGKRRSAPPAPRNRPRNPPPRRRRLERRLATNRLDEDERRDGTHASNVAFETSASRPSNRPPTDRPTATTEDTTHTTQKITG